MSPYEKGKTPTRPARVPREHRALTFDHRILKIMDDLQAFKDEGWSSTVAVKKTGYPELYIRDMRAKSQTLDLFFKNYNYKYEDEEND